MTGMLSLPLLRPLLARPMRLVACYVAGMILLTVPDLLLRYYLDADLPRVALLALLAVLAAAGLFLRASWRRRQVSPARSRRRFAFRIAVLRGLRGRDGASTRTAVIFDRYRRPGEPAAAGPGRISRR
jgi:hypothetical protein